MHTRNITVDCGFLKKLGQWAGTREKLPLTLPPMKSLLPVSPKSVKLILNVCGILVGDRVSMLQLKSQICFDPSLQTTGQPLSSTPGDRVYNSFSGLW